MMARKEDINQSPKRVAIFSDTSFTNFWNWDDPRGFSWDGINSGSSGEIKSGKLINRLSDEMPRITSYNVCYTKLLR